MSFDISYKIKYYLEEYEKNEIKLFKIDFSEK